MQNPIREIHCVGPDTPEQISPPAAFPGLSARGVKLAGLSDAGRGYRMHRPRPSFGHLLVTLGGSGMVWVDDEWVECCEGYAYVSPANAASAFETQSHTRWQFAWIFFGITGDAHGGLLASERSSMVPADAKPLASAIEGLYREGSGRADAALLEQWTGLIDAYCKRITHTPSSNDVDPLARLWLEVDSRLAAGWSISRLADQAGTSGETLRRLCIAHHGRSPMQHVTHLRMRRAETLLQSTTAKLAVIARMVGYENVFAFSTAFRRIYHVPPSLRREGSKRANA
jgi:AraC-like DNA-binding protein